MFYPAMINLKNKIVSVVGGGEVALRKVMTLLEFGAEVKVISPEFSDSFNKCINKIEMIKSIYKEELIFDSFLVVAATSSREVNKNIAVFCKVNRILCNVADDMELSDFIVPASIKRGSLVISVSTMGKSPSLASKVKRELEEKYDKSYEEYVELLGDIRDLLQEKCIDINLRKKLLNELVNLSFDELVKRRDSFEGIGRF